MTYTIADLYDHCSTIELVLLLYRLSLDTTQGTDSLGLALLTIWMVSPRGVGVPRDGLFFIDITKSPMSGAITAAIMVALAVIFAAVICGRGFDAVFLLMRFCFSLYIC